MEEKPEMKAMEEAGRLAERIAEIIRSMPTTDDRVTATVAAVSVILEKANLTLGEQAAAIKLVEVFFMMSAKEVVERMAPPPGVM
jgi:hypothetical protein